MFFRVNFICAVSPVCDWLIISNRAQPDASAATTGSAFSTCVNHGASCSILLPPVVFFPLNEN